MYKYKKGNPLMFWNNINKFLKESGVIEKMLKDKKELERNLIDTMEVIKHDKKKINKIKKGLSEYGITAGDVLRYIDHAETEIPQIEDMRILCLLTEQAYIASGNMDIMTSEYFADVEIKQSKQYIPDIENTEIKLPYTFKKVLRIDDENYLTTINTQVIRHMMNSKLLRYNFDTQRDAKLIKRSNTIQQVANVDMKSVKEIAEHLLKGTLMPTMITFNCLAGTSDSGEEVIYNGKKMELTVTDGTFIDILDGFHRITGVLQAIEINPDLEFDFQLAIKNYNTRTAQLYVGQINTVNKMSEARLQELKESRYSDQVVKQLQRESDLKGISQSTKPSHEMDQYVSFNVLSDAIDESFNIESKRDAMKVGEYLVKFFDYLVGGNPDAFQTNIKGVNRESIVNSNTIFYGYITLAERMYKEKVSISKLDDILSKIDFSRKNVEWKQLGILDSNENITGKTKPIKEYFNTIKIN